ncbi:hypothetical protein PENSPDRAFT_655426 [Peniophora sp. CONT]|nr:hypothetical protein PENSPDRAFT_655426 [Peniophora sp. CONT]
MSSLFDDPDSPTDLPSYEYSVTEKAPPSSRPPARVVDEDGWLIYDAGAFEAAANAASASASVSVSSRQSTLSRSRPSMMKRPPQRTQLGRLVVVNGRESPEDDPPPFTPTMPSYDGPAYSHQQQRPGDSRPASPLASPPPHITRFTETPPPRNATASPRRRPALPPAPSAQSHSPAVYAPPRTSQPSTRSLPVQDRPAPMRPSAAHPSFSLTHTSFNPNMAYSSSTGSGPATSDASAFYGSHVASAIAPSKPANSTPSQLYQSSTPLGLSRSQASLSMPPSPLLNRDFSSDRSSVHSRVSDSSVGSGSAGVSSPHSSVRGRASNASMGLPGPPPGAGYGMGPSAASARASMGSVNSRYSTASSSQGQWATDENQLFRDIYGSR